MTARGPLAVVAELTHRCPLKCTYCSNPIELQKREAEIETSDWIRVINEAAELGALHVHFTGGEPLLRPDLSELVAAAKNAGVYSNLITSGVGLTESRLDALLAAGLDHVQLSFQAHEPVLAAKICTVDVHEHKLKMARLIRSKSVAFTINLVVHRQNIDALEDAIRLVESLSPDRIEIAHTQYYGWAFKNRDELLPTRAQIDQSLAVVESARERLKGRIRLEFVTPDYFAKYPKACMGGWGSTFLVVDPAGRALPCHAAGAIPTLAFDNVRMRSLESIWTGSSAFNAFRGQDWMKEPCRSCDRREKDFGGCRCQAFLLAGDAAATDPVCVKAKEGAHQSRAR